MTLPKRLAVAKVAMVCVAAVALGSSTYAWFVSNTKVDATTSSISAQSNSAFMYIQNETETETNSRTTITTVDSKPLYPAHWAYSSENNSNYTEDAKFYTAFAKEATAADMKTDSVDLVKGNTGTTAGTPQAAEEGTYAVKNTFYVGTKGTNLKDLKVDADNGGISFISADNSNNEQFDNALRILVTCENKWVLCDGKSILASSNDGVIKDKIETGETNEVEIDVYVFYDGDDAAIYTNNLNNLNTASKKIKVTFTATPDTTTTANK